MTVMSFDPTDSVIKVIVKELLAAADRGVEIYLTVDAYNFLFNPKRERLGPLWWRTHLRNVPREFRGILDILNELDTKPTGFATITNVPRQRFTNPSGGRSHIKYTVINDRVFVGGCNLRHSEWLDLMVCWRDVHIADYLYEFSQRLHRTKSTSALMNGHDRHIAVDPQTELFIDSGKKGQSVIFKKALEFIDAAEKSLVITCQFFPNSITAKHLATAHRRGVNVEIIYAHPTMQGRIGGVGQQISLLRERLRVPAELFTRQLPKSSPGLHAKLIATEKGAIIGSHNYVNAGVVFGTAEIALIRHDPALARQALEALRREL